MKIIFKSLLIFIFVTFSANSEVIKEIKVDGNKRVSSETIKVFTGIKINSDLNSNQLNDVLKKIYSTNFFSNVEINVDKNILYISVVENPVIQTLIFEGVENKRLIKLLKEQIEMREKSSFNKSRVKNDEEKIINILRTNGYYFSKVSPKLKNNNNNTVDLIFEIELGDKAYIKKITFIGDKKIKENKLKKVIVSEENRFWKFVSSGKYLDLSRIKLDEKLLYNFYKNKGYYNVSVESSSAKVIDESGFELIFNINAGKKYYFGKFDLIIPDVYNQESFKKIYDIQNNLVGEVYSLNKIKKILNKID